MKTDSQVDTLSQHSYKVNMVLKGPVKAVSGHKITPNRFKTTYRSVLTFEEKKQSITHLFKTFSGLDQVVMRLFWQQGRKIRSTERFKTSAILNARFRESYFKLRVNGRAVTSQTDKQPNVEVGSVRVCTGQPTLISSSNLLG